MPIRVPDLSGWRAFEAEKSQLGKPVNLGTGYVWVGPFRDVYFIIPRARGGYTVWMGASGIPWYRAKVRLTREGEMKGREAPQVFRVPDDAIVALSQYLSSSFKSASEELIRAWGKTIRMGVQEIDPRDRRMYESVFGLAKNVPQGYKARQDQYGELHALSLLVHMFKDATERAAQNFWVKVLRTRDVYKYMTYEDGFAPSPKTQEMPLDDYVSAKVPKTIFVDGELYLPIKMLFPFWEKELSKEGFRFPRSAFSKMLGGFVDDYINDGLYDGFQRVNTTDNVPPIPDSIDKQLSRDYSDRGGDVYPSEPDEVKITRPPKYEHRNGKIYAPWEAEAEVEISSHVPSGSFWD